MAIPALGILGWVVYRRYVFSVWHSGWALIGSMLFLFAAQAIAVAAISALMKRSEKRITQRISDSKTA